MRGQVHLVRSGTHAGSPVLVSAGYVFDSNHHWQLAQAWQDVLSAYGLRHAREADCASGNGHYRHLTLAERDACSRALAAIVREHATIGFSVAMDLRTFAAVARDDQHLSDPHVFITQASISLLGDWITHVYRPQAPRGVSLTYVVDSAGNQAVQRHLSRLLTARTGTYRHYYGLFSLRGAEKRLHPPLQAADMLAWHHHHYEARRIAHGQTARRADFAALLRPQDRVVFISEAGIRTLLRTWAGYIAEGRHPAVTMSTGSRDRPPPDDRNGSSTGAALPCPR